MAWRALYLYAAARAKQEPPRTSQVSIGLRLTNIVEAWVSARRGGLEGLPLETLFALETGNDREPQNKSAS